MAERKPLFMNQTEGFSEEMATSDSITLGSLTIGSGGDITVSGGGELVGLPTTPSGPTAATSKAYVDQLVVTGGPVRGAVLYNTQLDNTDGINAALAFTMQNNPSSGDTITLTDGTTTRTYGAGTGGDVQYTIGATVADTMANLVAAIEGDGSAIWGAVFTTNLDAIDADGVVVIIEDANSGTAPWIYGTWTTPADAQIVDFSAETDYTKKTLENMPGSDPAATNFGTRVVQASLQDGEIRYSLENDVLYSWDDAGNTWQTLSSAASIPDATSASGGGVKGKVTFDSDKGLLVTAGVAEVRIDAVTLDFTTGVIGVTGVPSLFEIGGTAVGATVTAANLDSLTDGSDISGTLHSHDSDYADILHTHAHSDLTGIGTDDHHNQIHAIDGADHSASGLTTGHVLTATSATTFAFQAPAEASAAQRVENTLTTATDAIAVGDPVYINGADTVGKALASSDSTARVIGVNRSGSGAAPQSIEVVSIGEAAGVLSGATVGAPVYLAAAGGLTQTLPSAGSRVVLMGYAMTATDLWVDIRDYGKKAA